MWSFLPELFDIYQFSILSKGRNLEFELRTPFSFSQSSEDTLDYHLASFLPGVVRNGQNPESLLPLAHWVT